MNQLSTYLESIGLSKTESAIYLSALQKESITVEDIMQVVDVKQPAIYPAIRNLGAKGFITTSTQDGRLFVTAEPSSHIQTYLNAKSKQIEDQQLAFKKLAESFPSKPVKKQQPTIQFFNDIAGVKQVVETALNCESRQWRIIAPRQNFFSEFDKQFADYFITKRSVRHIRAKSLWEKDFRNNARPLSLQEIAMRRPRFLPEAYKGKFTAVIIMFDDKVAYISSLKGHHAVLIRSEDVSSTMGVMFDALWDLAKTT